MATPNNPRNAVNRQSAKNSNSTVKSVAKSANESKELDIEIISIDNETSFYTRKDGTEMERQTGIGFCPKLNANVIITRSLFDKDGNDKVLMDDSHVGETFSALVSKVPAKNGKGFLFFAEISLSRVQPASDESVNLFDSL